MQCRHTRASGDDSPAGRDDAPITQTRTNASQLLDGRQRTTTPRDRTTAGGTMHTTTETGGTDADKTPRRRHGRRKPGPGRSGAAIAAKRRPAARGRGRGGRSGHPTETPTRKQPGTGDNRREPHRSGEGASVANARTETQTAFNQTPGTRRACYRVVFADRLETIKSLTASRRRAFGAVVRWRKFIQTFSINCVWQVVGGGAVSGSFFSNDTRSFD